MNGNADSASEFGGFVLDNQQKLLTRNSEVVRIAPKTLEIFAYLAARPNEVISKEEIMSAVWNDSFVEDANLTVHISNLRKLFREANSGLKIETFPKKGYRLIDNGRSGISARPNGRLSEGEIGVSDVVTRSDHARARNYLSLTIVFGIFLLFAAVLWLASKEHRPFLDLQVAKLTTSGDINHQSISPDGQYVVYWRGGDRFMSGGTLSLWLKHISSASEVQLVAGIYADAFVPTFSPDGDFVFYTAWNDSEDWATYKMPILGGMPKRIGAKANISYFSPDGSRLAYLGGNGEGRSSIFIANEDGSEEREIAARQAPDYYTQVGAWSPDGRLIACHGKKAGEGFVSLIGVSVENGEEAVLSTLRWNSIFGISWLPDMSGLLVAGREDTSESSQIWHVAYPSGDVSRVTNDTNNYFWVSASADGRAITAIHRERPSQIWSVTVGGEIGPISISSTSINVDAAKVISNNKVEGYYGVSTAPGGELVYTSTETGNIDIWKMNPDGTNRRQLTFEQRIDYHPSVCGDGRHIVFTSNRSGGEHIWKMSLDGSRQTQLTFGKVERFPDCSPDGKWVTYVSWDSGVPTIWRTLIEGGEPKQLNTRQSAQPRISPDSRFILFISDSRIRIMSVDGSELPVNFEIPRFTRSDFPRSIRWSPDGLGLIVLGSEGAVGNLWFRPFEGEGKRLTNFASGGMWDFDFAKDGTALFVSRGNATSDVVLFRESKSN